MKYSKNMPTFENFMAFFSYWIRIEKEISLIEDNLQYFEEKTVKFQRNLTFTDPQKYII
jgi:hypothetical protein